MQADTQPAVGELDWEEIFSLLQDYGMYPPPLVPQPSGVEYDTDTLSVGQSGSYSGCAPIEEPPGAMMTSLDVFHGPEMEYNPGPQFWDQSGPMTVGPDMYYNQGLQYWQQPYQMMAPGMYYGPQGPVYWENSLELDSQAGPYIQDQFLSYQGSDHDLSREAAYGHLAGERLNNDAPKVMQPEGINMPPTGMLKREAEHNQDEDRPYVKRPPNAFMLFMKAQRPKVVSKHRVRDNAVVNKILGEMWKSMTKKDQAPYYEQARVERQRHKQQHPDWSCKENYGKKRKRERGKTATGVSA